MMKVERNSHELKLLSRYYLISLLSVFEVVEIIVESGGQWALGTSWVAGRTRRALSN